MSNNILHILAASIIMASAVLLILFGHAYVDAAYVFGTCTTLLGGILGYNFGVSNPSPVNISVPTLPAASTEVVSQDTTKIPKIVA